MAQRTPKQPSPPQQAGSSSAPHWGHWLRSMIRAAGYRHVTHFQRAIGCGRRQPYVWFDRTDAPRHGRFIPKLAAALGLTVHAVLVDWRGVRPMPGFADVRAAVLGQLAHDAARLDLPALYQVATLAALLAQYPAAAMTASTKHTTTHVGDDDGGQGTAVRTAGPVPGEVEEVAQRSNVQPAPSETAARAFDSSRVGGV